MAAWQLLDGRHPVDNPDDFPVKAILSETELRQELDRLRQLEPGIVSLTSPTGEALQIGIGGALAGVRWYRNPRSSEPSRDLLADRPYGSARADFRAEGDAISFWPEQLMPVEQAIDIVVYFFKHERLPDWVAWKEWDASNRKWNIHRTVHVRSA